MIRHKKYILITLFSLLMLFGFGGEVKAVDISNKNCGTPPEGSRYAIFALSDSNEVEWVGGNSLKQLEPKTIMDEPVCALVKNGQVTIDFDNLVEQHVLVISLADNGGSKQKVYYGNYGGNITDIEAEDIAIDVLATLIIDLKRTTDDPSDFEKISSYTIPGDTAIHEKGFRIRYRIERDGVGAGDVYMYFMGFANPDASGAITAIPKEKCWEMDGDKALCDKKYPDQCFWYEISTKHKCQSRLDPAICGKLPINYCGKLSPESTLLGSQACVWNTVKRECLSILEESVEQAYSVPTGYNGPMPPCAFSGSCHDTNDIVQLVVNFVANILLPFVGGAVFIMFVYGGFTIILSFGNPEKVKKGWGILIASLVGMGIVFGAYLLLDFVFTSLNISAGFRGFGR